ncbi:hypothetical protein IFR04_007703 [Cadophora malorum]|uniref:U3 small nucleolar RNA-associated protein 15 C-terminal domain-containing protein n=1 Tax=Cadophora malorum TaxID=108018 RepID=A0A8H7W8G7_9HELO|nr:hypothetical protein IFR04_007703 [Cadophora malorum]
MSHPVQKLQPSKFASGPSPITPDQRYWKSFKHSQSLPCQSPVTHISFPPPSRNPLQPSNNDSFVITAGTRVQIYSIQTRKLIKTITRFSDIAHSAEIRRDGRVMVAGDDSGRIQVFDMKERAILKTWDEHKQPVWATKFSPTEMTTLMSASDDRTVRLWDLPSQESTAKFIGHSDYVRSGCFLPGTMSNMLVTGSYDATVRLWDPRIATKAAMTFKHAAPVETVLPMPSGTTILAAADNQISVLDLVAGKPLQLLKNHQKTVTSLCLASNGTRLVSGGLDGHVKIFETSQWNIVAGSKYNSPVLSVNVIASGASQEDRLLTVGMQSGELSIKTRLRGKEQAEERHKKKEMEALLEGTLDAYDAKNKKRKRAEAMTKLNKEAQKTGPATDSAIQKINIDVARRSTPETVWERDLRQGRYAHALDAVLDQRKQPSAKVFDVLQDLRYRNALKVALEDREESTVIPIFKWVSKYLAYPQYSKVIHEVADLLIDLYRERALESEALEKSFKALHRSVNTEAETIQQMIQTQGMLKLLLTPRP